MGENKVTRFSSVLGGFVSRVAGLGIYRDFEWERDHRDDAWL